MVDANDTSFKGPALLVSADPPPPAPAARVSLFRRPTIWMTGAFLAVLSSMGIWAARQGYLRDQIAQWKDSSSNVIDTANLYKDSVNRKTSEVVFFYAPPTAQNSTPMISNGGYYYVDEQGLLHFGAVNGSARIAQDWEEFKKFKETVIANRQSDDPEKKMHRYQGMVYIRPAIADPTIPAFAGFDLMYSCIGSRVKGHQAVAFAGDHADRLAAFEGAAKQGTLVAFVVPIKNMNDMTPFDSAGASRLTGAEATLRLTQVRREFVEITQAGFAQDSNALLTQAMIDKLPQTDRDRWVHLYYYSAAVDKNMVLPNYNFNRNVGRTVYDERPMMVLQGDSQGNLTIAELTFENQIILPGGGMAYGEPHVRLYRRPERITEQEKLTGITFKPQTLIAAGWQEIESHHGDAAVKYIDDLQAGLKAQALDTSLPYAIPSRAIEVYATNPNESGERQNDSYHYPWGVDDAARINMVDIGKTVSVFRSQIGFFFDQNIRSQLVQANDTPIKSPDKQSEASTPVSSVGAEKIFIDKGRQR